ncbi:MAG: hypothetical protein RMY36_004095 [Nostoc sp. SerVER01]|nr:hypothetical protein [Nostoc sp. SerVER01]MDZ8081662.1 hypothetical protein [Nostoc sp. DcaGUA01]
MQAPPPALKSLVEFVMLMRARVLSFLPPRQTSGLFVDRRSRTYPLNNCDMTKLGPPEDSLKQKLVS